MNVFTSYLLPLLYLVLLAFVLMKSKYLLDNGISKAGIGIFFIGKCFAGILADYISIHYFKNGGDNWLYFSDGLTLYKALLHSPGHFMELLREMFTIEDFGLLDTNSDFIRTVFEGIKFIHFIADIFSFGNIYTNTILFNAIACPLFLRCWIFLKNYTGNWMAGAWLFLMPSAFFYTGNILKEGLMYTLIAALIPQLYQLHKTFTFGRSLLCVLLFVLLFFFKYLVAVTFAAALMMWWLMHRYPRYKAILLSSGVSIAVLLFFLSAYIPALPDLPAFIVKRQQEFLALEANSAMDVKPLQPGVAGFAKELPSAIGRVFFKPLPGEGGKLFYLAHTIEIYLFWFLILFLTVRNRFRIEVVKPLFWCLLLYAIANLLVIGYTIPSIGAMVRYRSIFLPMVGAFCWYLFKGNILLQPLPWRKGST